jgi:hypothetical protein
MDFIHKGVNIGPEQLIWFGDIVTNGGLKIHDSVTSHKAKEISLLLRIYASSMIGTEGSYHRATATRM